jgi:hypothetical protein
MKLKLSELPISTVIKLVAGETYIKSAKYIWTEILVTHGYYEVETLDEREKVKVPVGINPYIEVLKPLDDFFGDYKILSLPMDVVNTAVWFGTKLRNASAKTIIEDAIKYELVDEEEEAYREDAIRTEKGLPEESEWLVKE